MRMLLQIGVQIFTQRGSVARDLPVFQGVPNGHMFVDMGDALAGDRVDGGTVGILVLAGVLFTLGMFFQVPVEVAT